MPQLQAKLIERNPGLLARRMTARISQLDQAEQQARHAAADLATRTTRSSFHYLRPANAPRRAGRSSTGGKMTSRLSWVARSGPDAPVEFDINAADREAPHWIIQEIGTGESATIRRGGAKNPQGRPVRGADYVRTVRAQRGRAIPASLAFGTGPRGTYTAAGDATGQQLYLRSKLKGAPIGPHHARHAVYITKEIAAQHFVKKGAEEGFRQYRASVLAAARRAFAGQGYRP
jgi:hypothetical protein